MSKIDFDFYTKLKNDGFVLRSNLPKSIERSQNFQSLVNSNVLTKVRSGRGYKYEVRDGETLLKFYTNAFPKNHIQIKSEADNQLKYRDTKATKIEKKTIIFIRGKLDVELNGKKLDNLNEITSLFGFQASILESLRAKKICYVENIECFMNAQKIISDEYLFIHFYGRVPKSQKLHLIKCEHYLHWGDYDFVGLHEYLRAKEVFKNASLFIPKNFDETFKHYSKPRKSKDVLYENVKNSMHKDVVKIREMILESGNFLEQQIFLGEID